MEQQEVRGDPEIRLPRMRPGRRKPHAGRAAESGNRHQPLIHGRRHGGILGELQLRHP